MEIQQQPIEDSQQPQYQYAPQGFDPRYGQPVYPNQDTGFLQWLFSFRKEAIMPLRYVWRGYEFDFQQNIWRKPTQTIFYRDANGAPVLDKDGNQVTKQIVLNHTIMNEQGISWGISLIESYLNPVYVVSDFDEHSYNFTMKELAKVVWNSLCVRYKEFNMKKTDIPRVAEEIESKVRAILLGARNNGYRDFFSTQNQNIETRNLTPTQQQNRPGVFSRMANMFRKTNNNMQDGQQQQQY
jgi:hypothetical protein